MLLTSPIVSQAVAFGDRLALRTPEKTYTWSTFAAEISQRAAELSALGVGRQALVAHGGVTDADWVLDFHALIWLGAVPVLFPPDLEPAERDERLERAAVTHRIETLRREARERPADERRTAMQAPDTPGASGGPMPASWAMELPLFKVWTSGTTGTPRLTPVAAHQVVFSALGAVSRLGVTFEDCWLAAMPMHHVGGAAILLRSAIFGFGVELHERFDAAACNEAFDSGRATVFSAVPQMIRAVLEERGEQAFPKSLKAIMLGGASTPPALLERLQAIAAPVSLTWGMSETGSHVATNPVGDFRPSAAPIPFVQVREEAGQLAIRGPIAPMGSLRTSDRGALVDGRVEVHGRADDVIISGGENIDLTRIQRIYEAHPELDEVAVVGVSDERWGERPRLVYTSAHELPEESLRAFGRQRLETFEIPDAFHRIEAMPRNRSQKIDLLRIAEMLDESPFDS